MKINVRNGVLSLVILGLAGCSSPQTPPAQSAAQQQAAPEVQPAPEPAPAPKVAKPKQSTPQKPEPRVAAATPSRDAVPDAPPAAPAVREVAPAPEVVNRGPEPAREPAPPARPPEPTTHQVTIAAGTLVSIRMVDSIDSETDRQGDTFGATLESPIVVDNETVAPRGADVFVRLSHVESAGKLTGQSKVGLELDRLVINGKPYTVASNVYEKVATSQTTQTAKRTGIGAGIGAAVGAIVGGKKGAAIGAGVGGGTGIAIEATGKGEQVRIDPETRIDLRLQQPLEVIVDSRGFTNSPRPAASRLSDPAPSSSEVPELRARRPRRSAEEPRAPSR